MIKYLSDNPIKGDCYGINTFIRQLYLRHLVRFIPYSEIAENRQDCMVMGLDAADYRRCDLSGSTVLDVIENQRNKKRGPDGPRFLFL